MRNWAITLAVALTLVAASPAAADSWSPATRETYLSSDNATRVTVVPRELSDNLTYFSDKVDGKEPAGQDARGQPRATAFLERREGNIWKKIWEVPLVNDVAPVRALVANNGRYVVTFDNWHSVGFGNNVVVIYRADGSLVRAIALSEIVPEDYIRALPRSVSSIWWSGDHEFASDGERVIVKVAVPSRNAMSEPSAHSFVDVHINLETGKVVPPSGPAWERAIAAAAPLIARSKADEAKWRANEIASLTSPPNGADDEWDRYLYQAMRRLAPEDARRNFGSSWVLPAPRDPDFVEREQEIREVFSEWDTKSDLAFASPNNSRGLAQLLSDSASKAPAGRLAGSRLFVGLSPLLATGIRAALERTGATVIIFDPALPIPQRDEDLQQLGVAPDQAEAELARAKLDAAKFEAEAERLGVPVPPGPAVKRVPVGNAADLEMIADQLEAAADILEADSESAPR